MTASGNVLSSTDYAGNVTTYTYDNFDRVSSKTNKAAQTAVEMAEKYGANSDEAKKASEAVAGITKKLNDYQIQANNTTKNINQLEAAQRANTTELENFQSKLDSAQIDKLTNNIKSFDKELNLLSSELGKVTSSYDNVCTSLKRDDDLSDNNVGICKRVICVGR